MELRGQILDQFAEVHAVVGGEIEHQFAAIQRIFCIHQLHFQVVGGDTLLADFVGVLHIGAVLAHTAHIHGVGHADDRLDLAGEPRHLMGGADDLAALGTAGRGDDNEVALLDLKRTRVKIIRPAVLFKFDGYYFHCTATFRRRLPLPFRLRRAPASARKIFAASSGVRPPHCSWP